MPNGRARKHHYIPQFYLRRWLGPDRQLCEFALHHGRVVPHRKPTKGAGYETDLYTLELGPGQSADILETSFFAGIDGEASVLIARMVNGNPVFKSSLEVSALSRFLMSLFQRDPKTIKAVKSRVRAEYDDLVSIGRRRAQDDPDDAQAFEAFLAGDFQFGAGYAMLQLFRSSMDNPRVGGVLNRMRWRIPSVANSGLRLMTSDRPVIVTDAGLGNADAFLALPLSPDKAIIGFSNAQHANVLNTMPPARFAQWMNKQVVQQAEKYVYAADDSALRFVSANLGRKPIPSIQELLSRGVAADAGSDELRQRFSDLDILGRLRATR